jgi:spore germination protein
VTKYSASLNEILAMVEAQFIDCPDLARRKVFLQNGKTAYFIYFEVLINPEFVENVIKQFLSLNINDLNNEAALSNLFLAEIDLCHNSESIITALLSGKVVFISETLNYGIACGPQILNFPETFQPLSERALHGSNGFHENLNTNFALLRHQIGSRRLKFRIPKTGTVTKQKIAIAYLEGVANPKLLDKLQQRIEQCAGTDSLNLQSIKDHPYSPFPQFQITQRVDLAKGALLEGRLVVLREGIRDVLLMPVNFFRFFRAPDDFYSHWLLAAGMQFFRVTALLIVIILPGIYLTLTSFHYQFINLNLVIVLAQSRINVPFSPIVEVLIMETALTALYELGTRLATPIGVLLGLVGGLILGGGLLATGIVSSVLLVIWGLSLMLCFLVPIYHSETVRLLRIGFILFAGAFGMLGVVISASLTFAHLVVLQSLGEPYLQLLIPIRFREALKMVVKFPQRRFKKTKT